MGEYRELDQIHTMLTGIQAKVDTLLTISAGQEPRLQEVERDTKELRVEVMGLRGRLDRYRGGLAVLSAVVVTLLPVIAARFV